MRWDEADLQRYLATHPSQLEPVLDQLGEVRLNFKQVKPQRSQKLADKPQRVLIASSDELASATLSMRLVVEMPYVGAAISKNHMHRGGSARYGLTKPAKEWRNLLYARLSAFGLESISHLVVYPLRLTIGARLTTKSRAVDVQNAVDLVSDCVQDALSINDKHFVVNTEVPTFNAEGAAYIITIEMEARV